MSGNMEVLAPLFYNELELEKNKSLRKALQSLAAGKPATRDQLAAVKELDEIVKSKNREMDLGNAYSDILSQKTATTFDMQNALMHSMIKDTPEGHYQNALAKLKAENDISKSNYSNAFRKLQNHAQQNFERMAQEYPELVTPENINSTQKYYNILVNFAPGMATDPTVASSFIKKITAYGGVDEKMVQNLIQTNNEHMEHHSKL